MFVVVLVLCCLAQQVLANKCSSQEEDQYIQANLGDECRANLQLLEYNSQSLKEGSVKMDRVCSKPCLGRYADWLKHWCGNTKKAALITTSCLKQEGVSPERKCRYFFPDQINITSAHQCAAYFTNPECNLECVEPLQSLVTNLGCCFQSIYNDKLVIAGLHEQGFITNSEQNVLNLFQESDILENCLDSVPQNCSGEPFLNAYNGGITITKGSMTHRILFFFTFFTFLVFCSH